MPSGGPAALAAEEREDQRQQDAQHNRGRQGKVEAEVSPAHCEVAGEPSERNAEHRQDAERHEHEAQKNEHFPHHLTSRTPWLDATVHCVYTQYIQMLSGLILSHADGRPMYLQIMEQI